MKILQIKILENEYWWGGSVNRGHEMPIEKESVCSFDLLGDGETDQFAPLLVSSKGRYIWSEEAFSIDAKNGIIELKGPADIVLNEGFENLRGAYLAAMKEHFPFTGEMPDSLFWSVPQYNTWIELGTNQTTEGILNYAKGILEHGLPAGVLMIDGGWQEDYGVYDEFHKGKVPDPKFLVDELHKLGFTVMVWVSPIIASAGPRYKFLRDRNYLVRGADGEIAVRKWWSGYSAVLDFTNPDAVTWMESQLDTLTEKYGVDGFKFDAGDAYFYKDDDIIYEPTLARNHTYYFNKFGERYKFNEFRAAWKSGGRPIVSRLHDKYHSWNEFGINTLIGHTVVQGLLGYAYNCPDMVGGGIIDCFGENSSLDEELFVRWAQANCMMGMMQISIAPWRVLSDENSKRVIDAIKLHEKFGSLFLELAVEASKTGEPIVRHMSYVFPGENFETTNDQFMVGNDILVAPVIEKGVSKKVVKFPAGSWKDKDGKVYAGGSQTEIPVDMHTILYFTKC